MLHAIFYNGVSVLRFGWSNPVLRIVFCAELTMIAVGVIIGWCLDGRITRVLLILLNVVGLLIIMKNAIWGMSSDAYILLPFVGEILVVGTAVTALTIYIKKDHKHRLN